MMRGLVKAAMLSIFCFACLAIAATAAAAGDTAIEVAGNRHADANRIRSYFHHAPDGTFDTAALDAALKTLYASGLFQDVKISRVGDHVLVTVVENPTIARIAFDGNKKLKDDELKKDVTSKQGGPLSREAVHDDVEHILDHYRQHGYFDVHVDPKKINAKNDRVDLVFEIKEGDKLAVKQIRFVGNNAFAPNKLNGVIKTGTTNLLSFVLDNDFYDADRIEADRDLLRTFYLGHGYADVSVRAAASYEADQKGVVLTYTVDEGPQYRFGGIDIASTLKTVDAAALRRDVRTQTGETYDAEAINKTVDALAMDVAKQGEPFATVLARTERVPPPPGPAGQSRTGVIKLVYAIDQGKRIYVDRIEIHGNRKTQDTVIRREFDFGEGDAYNRALVDRAERRLKKLGYFKSVKIGTQPGSAPDRVVVDVELVEQDTGNFSIAGGYSTTAGVLAQVSISEQNFLGTGDIVKASVKYGQYARGFELGFTQPYFLDQRLALGVDLFGNQSFANTYQSYDSTVYGARMSLAAPVSDELSVKWSYSLYNQGLSLDPASGVASLPIQQAAAAGPIWISSVGTGTTYSTLDNAKNPTNGVRVTVNTELAGLGGAAKFARTTEDARYYHTIVGDMVGMVRAQGGYAAPWGGQQLPLLDGFFGGPQLVRGFAPNGFGPRDITPGTTMDNIGGNAYWTTSAELQSPMPFVTADAQLKVALFADAGSLWATNASSASSLASLSPSQQIANSRSVRSSLGVGLVWDSMFGPLQVTYAYPVAKQSYDVTQRLQFNAGAF